MKIHVSRPSPHGFYLPHENFSLFIISKNRLNKTPNWSPDQSLIAAFRKRNSNDIFLKTLLARMPLFFMSALVCVEIYCRVGRIKLKLIIHRFTSDFYGSRKLLTSRIQIQKIMKNEKNPAPNFWKLWTRNMTSIFIGLKLKNHWFSNCRM
jgi:hypothetical protein